MLGARMQMAAAGASGGTGPDGNTHYVEVTVQSSQVASNLTSFPVYVDLSDLPAAFFSRVRSDGGDIRVTKADGTTQLPREVVAINTGASTGELHFLADSLSSSSDTVFRIYYGNASATEPSVTDTYGRNAVWVDYAVVVHANGQIVDSTGNYSPNDADSSYITGKLGQAWDGNGSSSRIYEGGVSGLPTAEVEMAVWVNPDSFPENAHSVFEVGDGASPAKFYGIRRELSGLIARYRVGGSNFDVSLGGDPSTATWTLFHATFSPANDLVELFSNAVSQGSNTSTFGAIGSLDQYGVGVKGQEDTDNLNDFHWDGGLDEIRLRNSITSDDWKSAEYTNQNTPATFYSVGTEQAA